MRGIAAGDGSASSARLGCVRPAPLHSTPRRPPYPSRPCRAPSRPSIAFVPAAITAVCFIASAIWLTRRRAHIRSLCSALQARALALNEETSFAVRFRVTLYVYYMRKRGTVRLLFLVLEPRADAGAASHPNSATEQAPSYGSVDDRAIRQPLLE